jgi:hypothetical protein
MKHGWGSGPQIAQMTRMFRAIGVLEDDDEELWSSLAKGRGLFSSAGPSSARVDVGNPESSFSLPHVRSRIVETV